MRIIVCDDNTEVSKKAICTLKKEYPKSEVQIIKDPLLACKLAIIKGVDVFVCRKKHNRISGIQITNIVRKSRPEVMVRFIEDFNISN